MDFKVFMPTSEEELVASLMEENVKLMAGGTDLMVRMRAGREEPKKVISLSKFKGSGEIEDLGEKIKIGCKVTHSQIMESNLIKEEAKILYLAAKEIGSPQIRNRGTVVGNVVNASPAGDTILPLYLLNATILIHGPKGKREEPIEKFIKGVGKTTLSPGEYVNAIMFEKSGSWSPLFYKVGQRNAMAISVASAGFLFRNNEIRLAFGSVAPGIIRPLDAEKFYEGQGIENLDRESFVDQCLKSISPIDDVRASAWYRRKVIDNLVIRALENWKKGR